LFVLITIRMSRSVMPQEPAEQDVAPAFLASSNTTNDVVRNQSRPSNARRHPRVRSQSRSTQFSSSLENAMKSLSFWQSPTAALLQTPQDEMLNTLPRLGESLRSIKSFSPDQFN
jgi:hypothetical protein